MQFLGFLKCHGDLESIIDTTKKLEDMGVFVQPVPCRLILDEDLIEIAAKLAIIDFELGYNRARKISVQFLLRISGMSQIHKALKSIFDRENEAYYLVVFSTNHDINIEEIEKYFASICGKIECKGDIEEAKRIYEISEEEIKASTRPHEKEFNTIKKLVVERISTGILM